MNLNPFIVFVIKVLREERGEDTTQTTLQSKMTVSVSAPRKSRKGFFSHVVYQMESSVEDAAASGTFANFSVARRYSEVLDLHRSLVSDHRPSGVIVPPPPPRSRLATVAVAASRRDVDLNESVASRVFERKCVALDRYMKRLARHPVLRKDPNLVAFLQEKDTPK